MLCNKCLQKYSVYLQITGVQCVAEFRARCFFPLFFAAQKNPPAYDFCEVCRGRYGYAVCPALLFLGNVFEHFVYEIVELLNRGNVATLARGVW